MSMLTSGLLTDIFKPAAVMVKRPADDRRVGTTGDDGWPGPQLPAGRRTKLWEISDTLFCSIIGTCLSPGELRRVLARADVVGAETLSEHECHNAAVTLAGRPNEGGKLLHKALDRRHEVALRQFAKAKDAAAIAALWERALHDGDIPGAYWALLTHPQTSDEAAKKAFADVHMLSHQVGAANRADIRRLRELEERNAALAAKIDRQQTQLRDGFVERDATIRNLNEALARARGESRQAAIRSRPQADARGAARLGRELARETSRRRRQQQRLVATMRSLQDAEKKIRRLEDERDALQHQLASLEDRVDLLLDPGAGAERLDLGGATVLYVGGRRGAVPQIRDLLDRVGGRLLHHDGGIDDNPSLLPGLVSQAEVVMFPVDCVSHSAVAAIKRLTQQLDKRYLPLRSASLTCLLSALTMRSPARPAEQKPRPPTAG